MIFKIGDYIDGTIIIIEDDCAFALVANFFKCYIPIEEMTYNTMGHTAFEFVNLNENVKLKIKQIDYIENQMVCTLKDKIDMPNPYKNYKENEQYRLYQIKAFLSSFSQFTKLFPNKIMEDKTNNKTNNKYYEIDGELLTLSQIARKFNISRSNLANKVYIYKMSMQDAIDYLLSRKGAGTYRRA